MLRGILLALVAAGVALAARVPRAPSVEGRVVLDDGDPGEGVRVQRVCGSSVTGDALTDSRGRFTISGTPAAGLNTSADVSNAPSSGRTSPPRGTGAGQAGTTPGGGSPGVGTSGTQQSRDTGGGSLGGTPSGRSPTGTPASYSSSSGCELRVSLSGYQPRAVALEDDAGFTGVIVLHRAGPAPGMTVTATTMLAPKGARRAYERGLDAIHHSQPDRAQKEFLEAVHEYPRFAAAWLELGKVYEQRNHLSQARDAYEQSAAADPGFLYAEDRLCLLDMRESRWQEAADISAKVLRLDPYEFPSEYYFNAVSNLELNRLDAAERSARESAKLQGEQAEPRANYVLGVILWRKGDLPEAAEQLMNFLDSSYNGAEKIHARAALAEIENNRKD